MKRGKTFLISNILILLGFAIYFILNGNYEFIVYAIAIGIFVYLIYITDRIFKYSNLAKGGFVIWLLSHLSGGAVYIQGTRLYDTILIDLIGDPFFILRYDQLIHTYTYVVITLFVYSFVKYVINKKANKAEILTLTFLASMGIGAVNELIEFSTVALFNSTGVGNYFNNALDIVFNAIGVIIALFFVNHKK